MATARLSFSKTGCLTELFLVQSQVGWERFHLLNNQRIVTGNPQVGKDLIVELMVGQCRDGENLEKARDTAPGCVSLRQAYVFATPAPDL